MAAARPGDTYKDLRQRDVERLAADIYARLATSAGARQTTSAARADEAWKEAEAFYARLDARQTEAPGEK